MENPNPSHLILDTYSAVQLRDMCPCESCRHSGNGQRLTLAENLDLEISISSSVAKGESIELIFSDGHKTQLDVNRFNEEFSKLKSQSDRASSSKNLWIGKDVEFPNISWGDFQKSRKLEALTRVKTFGFCVISGVPTVDNFVLKVIEQFGFTRETNYGKVFDVRVEHNPNNLAFTDLEIPPHTDNPYRNPVPTIQLLHCLETEVEGGESGLVDGFKAALDLRELNFSAFEILTSTFFEFRYQNAQTNLFHTGPVIGIDAGSDVCEIRWNDRSMQSYRGANNSVEVYTALRDFSRIVNSPERRHNFKLQSGDCVIFDNTRLLHSRTAFEGSGKRHLQGAYSDLDGLFSSIRILEANQ